MPNITGIIVVDNTLEKEVRAAMQETERLAGDINELRGRVNKIRPILEGILVQSLAPEKKKGKVREWCRKWVCTITG